MEEAELFRSILEGLHAAVYVIDRAGKILFWNDCAERITGHLRQEMMGRSFNDNFLGQTDGDGNNLAGALSPVARTFRDGKPINSQISLRHKEGHRVPVELHTFALRDSHNLVTAVVESFEESIAVAEWDRRLGQARDLRLSRPSQWRPDACGDSVARSRTPRNLCGALRTIFCSLH